MLRGYEVGRACKARGAYVIYGGIHVTLYPDEMFEHGAADAVVKGDGDYAWGRVIGDLLAGKAQRVYEGGKIEGDTMLSARWDLLPRGRYLMASVQTVRGCPKHCSFCSVWRTDGQKPRVRASDALIEEMVQLRRQGFRFVTLADDNFYPVTLTDLKMADRREDKTTYNRLKAIRDERFELMAQMAKLPSDMNFFTQITMEAAEDPEYLDAMRKARIKGALVGIESVTPEGLKDVYKDFNLAGDALAQRLQEFQKRGVHVLGSFIFGSAERQPGDLRRHREAGAAGQRHLRAVRHADAVPRHARLPEVGSVGRRRRAEGGWGPDHAALADRRSTAGRRSTRRTR